jgi:hypothetical protein
MHLALYARDDEISRRPALITSHQAATLQAPQQVDKADGSRTAADPVDHSRLVSWRAVDRRDTESWGQSVP